MPTLGMDITKKQNSMAATIPQIKQSILMEVSFSKRVNSYYIFDSICTTYGSGEGYNEVGDFIEGIREATSELVADGKIEVIEEGSQTFYILVE